MAKVRVLMVGDSMRLAYQPHVAEIMAPDGIEIVAPPHSTGASSACAEAIGPLLRDEAPDAVCFACSPWEHADLAACRPIEPESMATFQSSLQRIAERTARWCGQDVVYVTTLHIHPRRFAHHHAAMTAGETEQGKGRDFAEFIQHTILQYNQLALELLGQMNVAVSRLNKTLEQHLDEVLDQDGVSLSTAGMKRMAQAVADGIYLCL